jgi:hypothetical protein
MIASAFLCSFFPLRMLRTLLLHPPTCASLSEKANLVKGAFAFAACYEAKPGERANQWFQWFQFLLSSSEFFFVFWNSCIHPMLYTTHVYVRYIYLNYCHHPMLRRGNPFWYRWCVSTNMVATLPILEVPCRLLCHSTSSSYTYRSLSLSLRLFSYFYRDASGVYSSNPIMPHEHKSAIWSEYEAKLGQFGVVFYNDWLYNYVLSPLVSLIFDSCSCACSKCLHLFLPVSIRYDPTEKFVRSFSTGVPSKWEESPLFPFSCSILDDTVCVFITCDLVMTNVTESHTST